MANVIDCVVKNMDASGNGTSEETSDVDSSGSNDGDRRKRCKTIIHIIVVAAMIAIVWGLIIVSVVSPYFPRGYEVDAKYSRSQYIGRDACMLLRHSMTLTYSCKSLKQATLLNTSDFDDNLIMSNDTPKGNGRILSEHYSIKCFVPILYCM